MKCPSCGHYKTHVYETEETDKGRHRWRECLGCGYRFATIETIAARYRNGDDFELWLDDVPPTVDPSKLRAAFDAGLSRDEALAQSATQPGGGAGVTGL